MKKQKIRFVRGSVEKGISKDRAIEIFEMLSKFAAYGFNKSHSAAYAWKSDAASRLSFVVFLIGIDAFRATAMLMVILFLGYMIKMLTMMML